MTSLAQAFAKLKLRVTETRARCGAPRHRSSARLSFWIAKGTTIAARAPQAFARMKERGARLTRRSAGRQSRADVHPLGMYLTGWKAYFRLAETAGRVSPHRRLVLIAYG